MTTGRSQRLRCGASAWANAASTTTGRCVRVIWRRSKRSTAHAGARMLFEVLQGEVVADTWNNEYVKRSLDLCLSCKACKSECPANVDLATYRSEFLSHYYESHARPLEVCVRHDRPLGAARLRISPPRQRRGARTRHRRADPSHVASGRRERCPASPPARSDAGRGATASPPQAIVRGSRCPRRRAAATSSSGPTRSTTTSTPRRPSPAYEVLGAAGFDVSVPQGHFCCGRPLYDFGMLTRAKTYLRRIMDGGDESTRAARWWCWSQAAHRCFGTSSAIFSLTTRAPSGCVGRPSS